LIFDYCLALSPRLYGFQKNLRHCGQVLPFQCFFNNQMQTFSPGPSPPLLSTQCVPLPLGGVWEKICVGVKKPPFVVVFSLPHPFWWSPLFLSSFMYINVDGFFCYVGHTKFCTSIHNFFRKDSINPVLDGCLLFWPLRPLFDFPDPPL